MFSYVEAYDQNSTNIFKLLRKFAITLSLSETQLDDLFLLASTK